MLGHQIGVIVAALGWMVRGSYPIAGGHLAWLIVARVAFAVGGARSKSTNEGLVD